MSLFSEGKLKAPAGKFRVVGVDTWTGPFADTLIGDFPTREQAVKVAKAGKSDKSFRVYIYDDAGKQVKF